MRSLALCLICVLTTVRGQNETSAATTPQMSVPIDEGPGPGSQGGGGAPVSSAMVMIPFPPVERRFCPGQKPGFLGDTCSKDQPCYNDYSLECKDKKCQCRKGYIVTGQWNGLCENAPSLNQPCTTECMAPFVCRGNDGPTNADQPQPAAAEAPDSSADAAMIAMPPVMPPPNPTSGKICRCEAPYRLVNGYLCTRDCNENEFYDQNDGKCKPRCNNNQVKLDDGSCADVKKIGQDCRDDKQCTQAFAACSSGLCRCRAGFDETNGECKSKKTSCPFGSPLTDPAGSPLKCNRTTQSYPDYQTDDSCPKGSFCLIADQSVYSGNNMQTGYCCERPTIACPQGEPLATATCGPIAYPLAVDATAETSAVAGAPPDAARQPPKDQCPYETHYCYTISAGSFSDNACCPKTCPNNFVLVEGTCYQIGQYGDACVKDEQCQTIQGVCSEGTCKCPSNSQAQGTDGSNKYCSFSCQPNQILVNNKCFDRLKLGDSCGDKPSNLCPDNAGCDENGRCSCFCNFIPLGDQRCGPYPVCQKYYPQPMPILMMAADGGANGGTDGANRATSSPPIMMTTGAFNTDSPNQPGGASSGPRSNYTFCRLYDDSQPPVQVEGQCQKGDYCALYMSDFGLCCPTPEPICPNGEKGSGSCRPEDASPCGQGSQCYQYFQGQGGSSPHAGYTCCRF